MFLEIATGYKINLNAVSEITEYNDDINLYIPNHNNEISVGDDGYALFDGVVTSINIIHSGDMEVTLSPEFAKYAALKKWIEANTI